MARTSAALRARTMLSLVPLLRKGAVLRLSDLATTLGTTTGDVAVLLRELTLCGIPPFSPDSLIDLDIDGDTVRVISEPPALAQPLRLSFAETRALIAALQIAGRGVGDPLVAKIRAAAAAEDATEALRRALRAGDGCVGAEAYAALAEALESACKVRIAYSAAGRESAEERVVHPHALVNLAGVWYLNAYCESAQAQRTFRLDRIRSVEVLRERFTPPEKPPTGVVPDVAALPVATLRAAHSYPLGDRDWPGASVETLGDGTRLVRVPFASMDWLAREVCAALGEVEVVDPPEARAGVRRYAERLLARVER